ncbi:protein TBRG4-like [Centruroides sculpturatus]|uniref:protein TBRG4-like n=1 Tax=Centruroides sculpturatus TaxID=218467 RepID=UPI000C6D2023|nr:protein TBRG4-like [Centruroides sculpturatus]
MASVLRRYGLLTIRQFQCSRLLHKNSRVIFNSLHFGTLTDNKALSLTPEQEMNNANNVEQLLSFSDKIDITGRSAVQILQMLNKWIISGQTNLTEFNDDLRFHTICNVLRRDCQKMTHNSIIFALRNMLEMGLPPESDLVRFYENEMLWKARKMNLKTLITCMIVQRRYQETDLQVEVLNKVVQVIHKRWFEIADASDVIRLLQNSDLLDEEFVDRVEDKLLELLRDMTLVELHKILVCFSQLNRRPTPILKAISYHVNQKNDKLDAKQLVNTLFALNVLSFPDSILLQKIENDLLVEIPNINKPQMMLTLLISIGQLSWRNKNLIEACSDWMLKNLNLCRPQELAAYVITLAKVNYIPAEKKKIFDLILPRLSEKTVEVKRVWLDVVWSLAILKEVSSEHLASVLKPSFYQTEIGNDSYQNNIFRLKLLNVRSVAVIEHPLDPKLITIEKPVFKFTQIKKSEERQVSNLVVHALSDFIPIGKYMVVNQDSLMGITIDAEFIVDKNGKPQPIEIYGTRSGLSNVCKPLPNNLHRIAVVVWDFKDLTLDGQLTGINSLYVRLLKKIGYSVVEVPYTEFNNKLNPVKKVQYLQDKIAQAI